MRNLQQRILYIFLLAAACGALQAQPFGYIDCPVTGTSGLCAGNPTPSLTGVISVSGWALSSNIVYKVAITRDAVAGETGSSVFLVNATLVPGSRPDVASAYPGYPRNSSGWGAQILTNTLPNSNGTGPTGKGTYTLHAVAYDYAGAWSVLGSAIIVVDNTIAKLPFGTIDEPAQGGGTILNTYNNYGWVLTPDAACIIDKTGSTISVNIDNIAVSGHPTYDGSRPDVAILFPGLQNSNGAGVSSYLDFSRLASGLHTISWNVSDSCGHINGLGSRYFTIGVDVVVDDRSALVTNAMIQAIDSQIKNEFLQHWGTYAQVTGANDGSARSKWKIFVSDFDPPESRMTCGYYLGCHLVPDGVPTGIVYPGKSNSPGQVGLSAVLSHEILEMLADPFELPTGRFVDPYLSPPNNFVYPEICDPVKLSLYTINGVTVSDFVFPNWFVSSSSGPWDKLGSTAGAFLTSAGGDPVTGTGFGFEPNP